MNESESAWSGERLPVFRYHPDPVATGSIEKNVEVVCPCCGRRTGWAYCTTPDGEGDQPEDLCPWCIADGSAAERFGSSFVGDLIGDVPAEIVDEVDHRTPGFVTWQGEQWLTHCGDAAAFLGLVGWDRVQYLPDVRASLIADGWPEDALPFMRADGDLTGYLFKCLHCGAHLAFADAS